MAEAIRKLACFVKDVQYNTTKLKQRGLEHEEIPVRAKHANRVSGKILTAERIARLDSIGFCWNVWEERFPNVPKVSWQGRFEEALEYREEHGQWPSSQSMGTPIIEGTSNRSGNCLRRENTTGRHKTSQSAPASSCCGGNAPTPGQRDH